MSTACPSAVMLMLAPGRRHPLHADEHAHALSSSSGCRRVEQRLRCRRGRRSPGYSSFMYITCSLVPSTACSRRQVRQQQVLADRRAGAGGGDPRDAALARRRCARRRASGSARCRRSGSGRCRLRSDCESIDRVHMIAAGPSASASLARLQVRLLADEVGRLHLRAGEPGLDRVVLALELGAHQAVALLDATGDGVHADADGHDAELGAGLGDRCPTGAGRAPSWCRSPSRSRRRSEMRNIVHGHAVDQHVAHRAVREAGLARRRTASARIGDDLGHRRLGLRAPHAEGADAGGLVGEGDRAVASAGTCGTSSCRGHRRTRR